MNNIALIIIYILLKINLTEISVLIFCKYLKIFMNRFFLPSLPRYSNRSSADQGCRRSSYKTIYMFNYLSLTKIGSGNHFKTKLLCSA